MNADDKELAQKISEDVKTGVFSPDGSAGFSAQNAKELENHLKDFSNAIVERVKKEIKQGI